VKNEGREPTEKSVAGVESLVVISQEEPAFSACLSSALRCTTNLRLPVIVTYVRNPDPLNIRGRRTISDWSSSIYTICRRSS